MIETCVIKGCHGARVPRTSYCSHHHGTAHFGIDHTEASAKLVAPPPAPEQARHGRRAADVREGEDSGGDVDYYRVFIEDPKRTDPYMAECEDIIEALNMPFADGCAFKAIWRKNAQRALGHMKRGADQHGIRDSEKTQYYGERMKVQAQRQARKENAGDELKE